MENEDKLTTIAMKCGEKCRITFELSPLKRLLAWILNDKRPMQPLVVSIDAKMSNDDQTITVAIDNKHFKRFKVENLS